MARRRRRRRSHHRAYLKPAIVKEGPRDVRALDRQGVLRRKVGAELDQGDSGQHPNGVDPAVTLTAPMHTLRSAQAGLLQAVAGPRRWQDLHQHFDVILLRIVAEVAHGYHALLAVGLRREAAAECFVLQGDTFSISPGFLGVCMGDSARKVP
eukprot:SAG31_NODE_2840_length_5016_cov_15.783608_7_plen_153_part_00